VLRFRKPPVSFVCFLLILIGLGAATGYAIDALGVAAFCFFVASIDAKPSWKFWYDPPAKRESGAPAAPSVAGSASALRRRRRFGSFPSTTFRWRRGRAADSA